MFIPQFSNSMKCDERVELFHTIYITTFENQNTYQLITVSLKFNVYIGMKLNHLNIHISTVSSLVGIINY